MLTYRTVIIGFFGGLRRGRKGGAMVWRGNDVNKMNTVNVR